MSSLFASLESLRAHTRGFNSRRHYRHRSPSPNREQKDIRTMTTAELKGELKKAGVDYSNVVEKGDLVERLQKYRREKKGGSRRRSRRGRRTRRCS